MASDVQEVLGELARCAVGADASLGGALEATTRLISRLQQENQQLRNGVFQLQNDPAVCISDLFATNRGDVGAPDSRRAFLLHQHILHNIADGITVQDREFNIVYQNSVMQRAFGCHPSEKCYAVYEKRSAPCEGCGLAKALKTGEPVIVLRTAIEADGTTSFWENSCFPIFDENRNIVAAAEVCRNVTDRVSLEHAVKDRNVQLGQLNEELKLQAAELVEALKRREQAEEELRLEMKRREQMEVLLRHAQKLEAVGQLAAGIAHEINTPAQFVADNLGFLSGSFADVQALLAEYRTILASLAEVPDGEGLARRASEAEATADLAYIEQNVPAAFADAMDGLARISTIVRAMKEFAHADHAEKSLADVNEALMRTLTIARSEYAEIADVQTEFQPLPPVPCHIGDMSQVFLNLLVNAAHAIADVVGQSGQKGLIRLRTLVEGNCVRIDIQDTGRGIASEIRDRIFEPFFTTKEVGRGSGQGLTIAYSIVVDKHRGSLTFETEVGRGTTFTIRLPIEPSTLPLSWSNVS